MQPLCEQFVPADRQFAMEPFYPLRAYVCAQCFLVQVPPSVSPEEIFRDYAYFSSYSESWLAHAREYVDGVVARFGLDTSSFVIELASNDGYLLRNFVERGVPCLGIEPALNVAAVAREAGVPTLAEFFGRELAAQLAQDGKQADLVVGNNVLAQVPDIHDFVGGIASVLKPDGVLTLEFPHLLRLIEDRQFDTIYHEHFFYFSLTVVREILRAHGMRVFDVSELPTHGGSLRVFATLDTSSHEASPQVEELAHVESRYGLNGSRQYEAFQERVTELKRSILDFLIQAKRSGKQVVAYGAPGKGNTLLNYCGIRTDFFGYAVDRNPFKHGMFTPGTHIPIFPPERLRETRPDIVVIMPWNLKEEIAEQHRYIESWGGRFAIFLPEVQLLGPAGWERP
jgi:SAM-dependent methyltransferase